MTRNRTIARPLIDFITSPPRAIDDWATIEFDLTTDDLIADLDPGWLQWREELDVAQPAERIAA